MEVNDALHISVIAGWLERLDLQELDLVLLSEFVFEVVAWDLFNAK